MGVLAKIVIVDDDQTFGEEKQMGGVELRQECTCTGCNRCKPAGGPCIRGVAEESHGWCRECHECVGELWLQAPESD